MKMKRLALMPNEDTCPYFSDTVLITSRVSINSS